MSKFTSVVSFGCVHVPYQDNKALEALYAVLRRERPQYVVCLGDLLDCYDLSPYDRNPEKGQPIADEIKGARDFLSRVRSITPRSSHFYLPGNHEKRLHKYLVRQAPAVSRFASLRLENVLGLSDIGWAFRGEHSEIVRNWLFCHGDAYVCSASGNTVRKHLTALGRNCVIAHSHRQGIVRITTGNNASLTGVEVGCLCRKDLGERIWEIPIGRMADWQQGFSQIIVNKHSGKLEKAIMHNAE